MWIIKWIFAALLIAFIIGFAMQNAEQQVSVSFLHWQSNNLHLWMVMYISFTAGLFAWLVISIFHTISLRSENIKINKEVARLRDELDRLRNLSVEESITSLGLGVAQKKDGEI